MSAPQALNHRRYAPRFSGTSPVHPAINSLNALEVQSDQIAHRELTVQIAHRELTVSGCTDHVFEARGFNEQVLAVREHLVMNQGMRTPEVLAEVIDGATNLRQLDLVLASQRV